MLKFYSRLSQLRFGDLMGVYEEGNRENGAERYPNLPPEQQLQRAEQDFYEYLHDVFFPTEGAVYAVWEIGGKYVSALRLEPYRDGLILAALETKPEERGKGCAKALIRYLLKEKCGEVIYSHVSYKNIPSLRVHQACGFEKISDTAVYLDGSVNSRCMTLRYKT